MKDVFIVSAVRTPIGSFGGSLAPFTAVELAGKTLSAALEQTKLDKEAVDEVYIGNVISSNLGQAPARQVAIAAGLPYKVTCTTVNKVCSSGLKSAMLGAQSIILGLADVVVAGGMESMSNVPHYVPGARWGMKYGNGQIVDGLVVDGLTDVYQGTAMGVSADATAEKYKISREQQDEFAINSYKKAQAANDNGNFKNEIIGIEIPQKKGTAIVMDKDEEPYRVDFSKIASLRPAFNKEGTVTAANASTLNDGASITILASAEAVKKYNLTPLARIVAFADAEQEPFWFTTAPTLAAPLALRRAGLTTNDMDLWEVNEAFAVVPLAFEQVLNVDPSKVNIRGGACSIGHPLGASGNRILTTLVHALRQENKKLGLATLCNGGGGASAMIIETV